MTDNVLSGLHKSILPDEFIELWNHRKENGHVFLDVRPGKGSLPLAEKYPGEWLAIPLEELLPRINEIPRDKKVALICNTGSRAYDAQLKLRRHGIDTVNSAGGMQTMKKRGDEF